MAIKYTHDVQATRDEFLRQLPDAIHGLPHTVAHDRVTISDGDHRIHITLTDLGIEHLGALRLPMLRVAFAFEHMPEPAVATFIETWEKSTLRMGG
jgi:hypothetical protein